MLHNYYDKRKYGYDMTLEAEDGTEYRGEFIDLRIDPATIPEGKYWYHLRHGDDGDWTAPVTIENRVIVNFCGTFITDEPIEIPNGYIPIEDYSYGDLL